MVSGPAFDIRWRGGEGFGFPFLRKGIAFIDHTSVEFRFWRETGRVEPGVPVYGGEGFGGFCVGGEEGEKGGFEFVGVGGFLEPGCEVVGDEFVEGGLADEFLEVVEEVEALGMLEDGFILLEWGYLPSHTEHC